MPLRMGLIRNHYVGRTFIQPQQAIRHFGVKVKLNPVRSILEGKRVVLVDDSIVRGTTSRKIVQDGARRRARAKCTCASAARRRSRPASTASTRPQRAELIAATHTLEEIRKYLEADSLAYLCLEACCAAVGAEHAVVLHVVLHGRVSRRLPARRRAYLQLALKAGR